MFWEPEEGHLPMQALELHGGLEHGERGHLSYPLIKSVLHVFLTTYNMLDAVLGLGT